MEQGKANALSTKVPHQKEKNNPELKICYWIARGNNPTQPI